MLSSMENAMARSGIRTVVAKLQLPCTKLRYSLIQVFLLSTSNFEASLECFYHMEELQSHRHLEDRRRFKYGGGWDHRMCGGTKSLDALLQILGGYDVCFNIFEDCKSALFLASSEGMWWVGHECESCFMCMWHECVSCLYPACDWVMVTHRFADGACVPIGRVDDDSCVICGFKQNEGEGHGTDMILFLFQKTISINLQDEHVTVVILMLTSLHTITFVKCSW